MEEFNGSTNSTDCSDVASVSTSFDCVGYNLRVFHAVIMSIIFLVVALENATLLALVGSNKKLHTTTILSNMGLVVADLLVTAVWVFMSISSTAAEKWPFGTTACSIFAFLYTTALYVRWCEVFVLTVDRTMHIIFPFFYSRHSQKVITMLTITGWVFSAVINLPTQVLGFSDFYLTLTACSVQCGDDPGCRTGVILTFGFFITIGGLIPTILYFVIFFYGLNKKREMDKMLQMGSISGKNMAEYKQSYWKHLFPQANKALVNCFTVFVVTLITNIPLYITSSLRGQPEIYNKIPFLIHFIVMYIFLMGPLLDPIIVMRNKDIWEVIYKIRRKRRAKMIRVRTTSALVQSILAPEFLRTSTSNAKSASPTERYILKVDSKSSECDSSALTDTTSCDS